MGDHQDEPPRARTDADRRAARWGRLPRRVLPEEMVELQAEAAPPEDLGLDLNRENWIRYV